MKNFIIILIFLLLSTKSYSENNLYFYIESAFKNNPKLNSERENLKAIKQNINISRSEFLPNLTISGSQTSTESSNRINQSGSDLNDINLNTEQKKISVDQKIFQGFSGYNSLKKSQLEYQRATFQLRKIEQEIILDSIKAYYDLIFKTKNKKFNLQNMDLFEQQVETDKARLQRGEINLTDLAQSESSLAGANANLISAENDLQTAKNNFERIIRVGSPDKFYENYELIVDLPSDLKSSHKIAETKNPSLMIAKLDSLISEKELSIEKAKLSPTASLNYTKSENKDFSSTVDEVDEETVKATLSWPIIKGGKNFSSVKKFSHKKEQNKLIFVDTENATKTDTTTSWSTYQSSKGVLQATKSQLKAAEIANEGITLEYDSGNSRTTLEVIQSRTLLLNARIAYARAQKDLIISKFNFLAQLGNLTLESVQGL